MLHAENGEYILATSVTPGTGQTWVAAQTAFSDTAPNWYIFNPSAPGGRTIWLRRLKMISSQVGTAAISWRYAVVTDTVGRKFTTDNTAVIQPVSPGPAPLVLVPTVQVQNSATVSAIAASSGNSKVAARGTVGGLNIAATEYEIVFGSTDFGSVVLAAVDAAGQPGRKVSQSGPVGIPPGGSAVIHIWGPSSSASLAPEWELGMIAR